MRSRPARALLLLAALAMGLQTLIGWSPPPPADAPPQAIAPGQMLVRAIDPHEARIGEKLFIVHDGVVVADPVVVGPLAPDVLQMRAP